MDSASHGNLRLYSSGPDGSADPHELANRELIRPHTYRRAPRGPEPFSPAWFDEIESRRYARHGAWLPAALEFNRHPGESVLLLNPGLGTDAVQYLKHGMEVTLAAAPHDHPTLLQANLEHRGLKARMASWDESTLPFADSEFDIALFNGLHRSGAEPAVIVAELFRVLKPGGKIISLFPAKFDAGYWQDIALPLQYLYWHRPPDPTTSPKTTSRSLRRLFTKFEEHRVCKRHLRRSELPHLWRLWPLTLMERFLGRVLVFKALKPLSASRTAQMMALGTTSLAA